MKILSHLSQRLSRQSSYSGITRGLISISMAAMLALPSLSAQAIQYYKSTGSQGEVKFSQYPPNSTKDYEIVELRSDGRKVEQGDLAGKTDPNQQSNVPNPEEQRIKQLEKRIAEQEKRENAQRCQKLRQNLTNLNIGGRLFETTPDGERKYLDNSAIDQKREKIRQAISQYCSGSKT